MPTSMWTRLSGFGILDLEHAERSYVNWCSHRFVVAESGHLADWWLSPLLLKAFGRSAGFGIVCRIMTNDLDIYWEREDQTATNLVTFSFVDLFHSRQRMGANLLWDSGDVRQKINCASATEYTCYTCYTFYICYLIHLLHSHICYSHYNVLVWSKIEYRPWQYVVCIILLQNQVWFHT